MICPNCKQENADGSVFCGGCGSRLQPPAEQPPYAPYGQQSAAPQPYAPQPYAPQPVKPKKPVNKKLIGILCGAGAAVVLVVVLLVVLLGGGKGYETVAKNYLQACAAGDRRAAKAYICPELEDEPIRTASPIYYDELSDSRVRVFDAIRLTYTADQLKVELDGEYGLSSRRVGDIYDVVLAVTFYDEDYGGEVTYPYYICVAQIDGNWYVI